MLVPLDEPRASLARGRLRGRIELYAADQAINVTIDGRSQPLEADPTAAWSSRGFVDTWSRDF